MGDEEMELDEIVLVFGDMREDRSQHLVGSGRYFKRAQSNPVASDSEEEVSVREKPRGSLVSKSGAKC